MERWFGLDQARHCRPVVAIGVYDGVHRGHRMLIRRAISDARRLGVPAVVLTFDPNPAEVVSATAPARLSTLAHRLELVADIGVDATLVLPFTPEFAEQSPKTFVLDVLAEALGATGVVVGENFRFGYRASGTVASLHEFGAPFDISVDAVPLLHQALIGRNDVPLSSSEIRALVAEGKVSAATRALARPHRVEGVVVKGAQRGRELGFPTANVHTTPLAAIPGEGVYAAQLRLSPYGEGEQVYPAAVSIGTNPTFDGQTRTVEAYVLDAGSEFNIYDRYVAVDFIAKLRDQEKFPDAERLITQMHHDVALARRYTGLLP